MNDKDKSAKQPAFIIEKYFSCNLVFPQFSEAPCWLACKIFWVGWFFFSFV